MGLSEASKDTGVLWRVQLSHVRSEGIPAIITLFGHPVILMIEILEVAHMIDGFKIMHAHHCQLCFLISFLAWLPCYSTCTQQVRSTTSPYHYIIYKSYKLHSYANGSLQLCQINQKSISVNRRSLPGLILHRKFL